ncbi:MAG TPA: murein transglycosylase A [Rhizomicrobium sp.]|nr:murein transglycosylase A [Rhizomicrobium sp.]
MLLVLLLTFSIAGTGVWILLRPPPSRSLTLVPLPFAAIRGWQTTDARAALAAFQRSCSVILRFDPARPMGGAGYAGRAADWRHVCEAARRAGQGADGARKWFEAWFSPFAAGSGYDREALFTGYFEPEIQVSREQHGSYTVPIYGPPEDLVTAELGDFRSDLAGTRISGRVENRRLVPFPSRSEIEKQGLSDAPVLLYANSPVSLFFMQIQGSGRGRLEDGTMLRLAYAAQNGRTYTPIGRTLIRRGALDRAHVSMHAIKAWLEAHPGAASQVMESDDSYIFFRELPIGDSHLGSPGTEGVPLTPEASIAIDTGVHALGVPMFVDVAGSVDNPDRPPMALACLCIAQDRGGAIKGNLRADVFWGFGAGAEAIAGSMKSSGLLYVLLPKTLAANLPSRFSGTRP